MANNNNKHRRAETGTLQFGDDYPGIFIRGDNAGWFGFCLKNILNQIEQGTLSMDTGVFCALRSLENTLTGCDTRTLDPAAVVLVKDFEDCLPGPTTTEETAENSTITKID